MVDLFGQVDLKIRQKSDDDQTLGLWQEIVRWYNEGGPSHVEVNIEHRIREIKSSYLKGVREIEPEVQPSKRKAKRRR